MTYVRNSTTLTDHGEVELRKVALDLIEHSLAASDPYNATHRLVHLEGEILKVGDLSFDLRNFERILVIGAGKATGPIALALEDILGDRISQGIVVLKKGYQADLKYIQVVYGAHPVPDEDGHIGAQKMYDLVGTCTQKDLVLAAITGGSSALLPLPVEGVSLDDKKKVNELLLLSGADITQINAVRKHLSRLKGGWLAKRILPATLINLTVSDVIGDPLDYITDPTVPDTATFNDARRVMDLYNLWDKFPPSASSYLRKGSLEQETPKDFPGMPLHSFIVVNSAVACEEAERRCRELGYTPIILTTMMKGEAREAGSFFGTIAAEIVRFGRPLPAPCAIIAGGENTVTINGPHGEGGPNQEFALSASREIHGLGKTLVCSLDTDGTDGPTPLAGGLVDGQTLSRAGNLGMDIDHALQDHETLHVIEKLGDAILTGHTGTNINDLKFILVSK